MEKIEDVIELLESVKGFRVNDELPFGTVDYMQIDSAIEFLSRPTPLAVDACPFCVAGFDPNFEGFVPCTACDGTGRATKA